MRYGNVRTVTLFSKIQLQYGPLAILGRTILAAEQLCNLTGVTLTIATGEEMLAANASNTASWLPLTRILDCRFNPLNSTNALFVIGRDSSDAIVACQAIRHLNLHGTNFADEIEGLRLHYSSPETMAAPGESYRVTSLSARGTTGHVAYSGGAWYRNDYRGVGLVEWLPRLARAYARSVWDTRTTVTLMEEKNVARGVFPRNGYRNLEWAVHIENSGFGSMRTAYLWLKDDEMLEDLEQFLRCVEARKSSAVLAVGSK